MSAEPGSLCRHFLADLHLSPQLPELTRAFVAYLRGPATQAQEIYLLGDIFEYWLGDDISMPEHTAVIQALSDLPKTTRRYFAAGNRDFLLGKTMAKRCGFQILPQPSILSGEPRTVVLHGDQLCTSDRAYQRYRRVVNQPWVQSLFTSLPRRWRQQIARRLRLQSQMRQQQPQMLSLTDASPEAVDALLAQSEAELMIHGHTHRPASHQHPHGRREVLTDWRPGHPQTFSWLVQDHRGLHRESLSAQAEPEPKRHSLSGE
nr:UDP-2,3-diacylglucosamine diphosphatase [Oceanococcus sp. HetDA_MAG_MS8]